MDHLIIQKEDKERPTRLVIMCCDDPHHLFLIEQLTKQFEVSGIIIETNEAQMNRLYERKKYKLWAYRKYHSQRRKLQGHSKIRNSYFNSSFSLDNLSIPILYPPHINSKATVDFLEELGPDLTICAGTMFIGKKVRVASNNLINLHGGILPEYKGNQCIFFALHEKQFDKVGGTLHLVTAHLDGGPVIDHVKPAILANDNDETLYCKTFQLSVEKLLGLIKTFNQGDQIKAHFQERISKKTYSHCDRTPWVEFKHHLFS